MDIRIDGATGFTAPRIGGEEPARHPVLASQPGNSPRRLLLIEDDTSLRKTFGGVLRTAGFLVAEASEGQDGLRQLSEAPVDLVLTDLAMPGMSGWEVARSVRQTHPNVPVVLITGNIDALEASSDLRAHVSAILLKPFGARPLLEVVWGLTAEGHAHVTESSARDGRSLSVLLVEDNAGDARLIQELLRGIPKMQIVWVNSLATTLARLAQPGLDLILLDLGLPDSQGLETVTRIVREHPTLPVIVVTGRADDGLALATLKAGAQDYLVKGTIEAQVLIRAIQYAYERKRSEMALHQSRARREQQALPRV